MTPSKMKVTELREALQSRGLSPKGLKKDLVERLEGALQGTAPTPLSRQLVGEYEAESEEEAKEDVPIAQRRVKGPPPEPQGQGPRTEAHSPMNGPTAVADAIIVDTAVSASSQPQALPAPSQAPAPRASPTVVHISNFVRPFTIPAVKDLVGQFGPVLDFWMDALKSHCFVHYASSEAAADCRRHLDGLRWPLDCGRLLGATASSVEAMQTARNMDHLAPSGGAPPDRQPLVLDTFFCKTHTSPVLYYLPAHPLAQ